MRLSVRRAIPVHGASSQAGRPRAAPPAPPRFGGPGGPLARALFLAGLLLALGAGRYHARAGGGVPAGMAWVGRVADPAEMAACRDSGFSAVRLDVPWTATPNWDALDRLVTAAEENKLRVIVALQVAAPPAGAGAVDPDNPDYVAQAKIWIQNAVEHFRGSAAVVAWMMPDEPEAALRLTDAGFRAHLMGQYGDLAALNAAWKSQAKSLNDVTAAAVMQAAPAHPLGISRAGTDLALFRQQGFVRLLRLWARFLRGADEARPLVTGGMARYRCLISVPEEYDAVTARVAPAGPGRGEAAEAVGIARRSGHTQAIASLPSADPLGAFGAALMQGAAGVAVEDWRLLRAKAAVRAKLRAALDGWRQGGYVTTAPRPTAAILYEPFAESYPVPSPLYTGYLAGADAGDLEPLLTTFRQGSAYGQVGYLAREDLAARSLSSYEVLFCPLALSLSPEDLQVLHAFVSGGGVVVAGPGLGCYEAGGEAFSWSSGLATLLGVGGFLPPIPTGGQLRVYERSRLFPSIAARAVSRPLSFAGLVAPMVPLEDAVAFGAVADLSMSDKRIFGGLLVRPLGKGWVVFASMNLWQNWSPLDPLFLAFHRDLLSRSPAVALPFERLIGGDVQIAAFDRGLAARNTGTRTHLVRAVVAGDDLYAGSSLNVCRPASVEGIELYAGLAAGNLGLYERVPVRCVLARGMATVAVEEYGPESIKIVVCGGTARVSLSEEGKAVMSATDPTPARLVIRDGRYPLRPGTVHRLRARDLETGRVQEHRLRVAAEGKLELDKVFSCDVLTLTPEPKPGP